MFDLRNYLPYLLNRVGFAVTDVFTEALSESALTVPAWRVLAILLRDGALRIGELADLTSIEVSTLSRLVDNLERHGFVVRKNAKNDARVVNVTLTLRGRTVVTALVPAAVALEERLVDGIPASDVAELKRLLDKLYHNIAHPAGDALPDARPLNSSGRRGT